MEQKLPELLQQLHRFLFADSEQVIVELRHYLLDRTLNEADLAFASSKIFNSHESLLEFLRQRCLNNDRILATVKKRLYELIIDYMKLRKQEANHYLAKIKETCMVSFVGDPNSLVKEAAVQVLIKVIETYNSLEIQETIQPAKLLLTMIDEIKLRRPSATVKGAIWSLIGLLHREYDHEINSHHEESQKIQYMELEEQVKKKQPEIKAIIGMLKGFTFCLETACLLSEAQMQGLYLVLKTIIRPIPDVNNRGVMKAGMKLLSQHAGMFTDQIVRDAVELIKLALQLSVEENIEVRDAANDLLGSVIRQISDTLQVDQDTHVALFRLIMEKFDEILTANDYRNIQLLSAIRAVGIFSKAIKTILGDEKLWDYLERLTELSEQRLIREFQDQQNPHSDLQNFKYILKKQKVLFIYLCVQEIVLFQIQKKDHEGIVRNLNREPSEKFLLHFMKIGSIGVNNHRKLYNKYRWRFYEALAQLSMSLAQFQNPFTQWIKKFVRGSLTETLKIPDSVVYGGESPAESLNDAVQFWMEYLGQEKVWSQPACQDVYDQLIQIVIKDIEDLNLTYKVQKVQGQDPQNSAAISSFFQSSQEDTGPSQPQIQALELQQQSHQVQINYIANNNNDQQYFERLSNFLELFLTQSHDDWLIRWVPTFTQTLVKKSTQTPRISKIYSLLKTVLKICSKHQYFQMMEKGTDPDCKNTFNMLLTFLKELIGKSEEFQDELLVRSMQLLLNVPIEMIHQKSPFGNKTDLSSSRNENLHLWKGIMIKALELSHFNNSLAVTCIQTLEIWFNALPVSQTAELYADIVPKLSYFLTMESNDSEKLSLTGNDLEEKVQENFFFQDIIKDSKEEAVDKVEIAGKVLDLLGKIGGHAHSLINNELSKKHDKENYIRWDPEKRLKFAVPLHSSKIDIYLDSCLPRIVDLAQNSNDKETRIAACELLHALILYMIGQSATNSDSKIGNKTREKKAAFAKLYSKLFPVIIRLATEIEQISRQLFEPLCFQIVRWFSRFKIYEHPEVEHLLDALIEGAQSRNNYTLREMCSNAVAEFASWSLKHAQDAPGESVPMDGEGFSQIPQDTDPTNIKSLVRRIESNSNHPDPFKRLSSVLCFSKLFNVIKDHETLVDEFCLEITRCVLGSLKLCHNSLEFSQEVIDNCEELLSVMKKQIVKSSKTLMQPNQQRSVHTSLLHFLDFLFSKFTSIETVYRHECMKLWAGLVSQLHGNSPVQQWILSRYVPEKGAKSIYWNLEQIQFPNKSGSGHSQPSLTGIDSRKGSLLEAQKAFDQLAAQLEFLHWILTVAKFSFSDLSAKLRIDLSMVALNIVRLFKLIIIPKYNKIINGTNPIQSMLVCKEEKEQLIKSKIRLLSQLFLFMNCLKGTNIDKLEHMLEEDSEEEGIDLKKELFNLALQILLVPASHRLQLLVQDVVLEKQLKRQCETFIKKAVESQNSEKNKQAQTELCAVLRELIQKELPITDLSLLKEQSIQDYQPRMLENLVVGYLKLAEIDQQIKQSLVTLSKEELGQVVEKWTQSNSPQDVESTRILVQFMCKLNVPNEMLYEWLTTKYQVYQKASDLLLQYIADNWSKDRVQVGEYLIMKAGENMRMTTVFIPILEHVSQRVPGYQTVLLKSIPESWQAANYSDEYAENQVRIFSLIITKCKWAFENQEDKYATSFISFVSHAIINFLQENKFQVYLKKSVLNLVGLLFDLNLPSQTHLRQTSPIQQKLRSSLVNLQDQYFPICTRELKKNSNESLNFEQILEGFLDLVDFSKNVTILRMLYKCIREHKPAFFAERLKQTVNNFVKESINKAATFEKFKAIVDSFMEDFYDTQLDSNVDDNVRWAIGHKILARIMETCALDYLRDLFIGYFLKFQGTLETQFDPSMSPLDRYLLIRQKTHIFLFLEIMVRRLNADLIKVFITQEIYGQNCSSNELTKYLIITANNAKSSPIDSFIQSTKDSIHSDLPYLNSPFQVQRRYACAAYALLSSVILKTQSNQKVFTTYLFSREGQPSLWGQIIDCSSNEIYKFAVQTNFNFVNLKSIETKMSQYGDKTQDLAKVKANNLVNEYVKDSFMSTHEKFQTSLIFESQFDDQKVDEIVRKKMYIDPNAAQLPISANQMEAKQDVKQQKGDSQDENLEMDEVNQHECMKNVKRCLDKMQELFSAQWQQEGSESLPVFMQSLRSDFEAPTTHQNVRIFILKLLVNNSALFKPYAKHWFHSICSFIAGPQTGGKGFHYFLRDLCTLLIQWNDTFTPDTANDMDRKSCCNVINTLIKLAADKNKLIFNLNIEIIAVLMLNWQQIVILDKELLCNMLALPDSKEGSHLWKMTAIQIIALASSFDVPVLSSEEMKHHLQSNMNHEFQLGPKEDGKVDMLFKNLLKMQELRKKQLIFASSEALGKILCKQPVLVQLAIPVILQNAAKDRDDIFVNVVERITRDYPGLLSHRRVLLKIVGFVNILTGSMRGSVFKTLDRYIQQCGEEDLIEVSKSILAVFDDILADISDDNQQNFLILLTTLTKTSPKQALPILQHVVPRLKLLFAANKNEYSRALFYDLMVYLYDNFKEFQAYAKSSLIRGLADPSKEIKEKLICYWNDSERLCLDPQARFVQILTDLYDQDEEHIWLNNAIYLLLQASEKAADFQRPLFNFDLNCSFAPLLINQYSLNVNRQQPVTSSFALINQMVISASQAQMHQMQQQVQRKPALSAIKEEGETLIETDVVMQDQKEVVVEHQSQEKPANSQLLKNKLAQKVKSPQDIQMQSSQGQPLFTASQQQPSQTMLIASHFAGPVGDSPPNFSSQFFAKKSAKQRMPVSSQYMMIKASQEESKGPEISDSQFVVPIVKRQAQDMAQPKSTGQGMRSKFFKMNDVEYTPIQESQGSMIRCIPDGSMPAQLARKEEKQRQRREQLIQRQLNKLKKQVNLIRQYRVGELPDIQIHYKDVLLPLMALVRRDSTIATEVFVELFAQIYKDTLEEAKRSSLGDGIKDILTQSIKFDYGAINCMHRVAIELLKIDKFTVDADIIARTGKHSMSFQTSLNLLEELILKGASQQTGRGKKMARFQNSKINQESKPYWFSLVEMYEIIGNQDALFGIRSAMGGTECMLVEETKEAKKSAKSKKDPQPNKEYEDTLDLIQKAQNLSSRGCTKQGLLAIEEALAHLETHEGFEKQVTLNLQNKKFESLADLLKWEQVSHESLELHNNKQLYEIPSQQAEIMIRAFLRKDQYWETLNKWIQKWHNNPTSKAYLDSRFNFEQALMFVTAKDFDRARFFINKEANDLISQWQDMAKLSQVAQHMLVQKIQKVYEMKEFLQTTKQLSLQGQEDIMPQVFQQFQNWIQRRPSYSFDKLLVWDDILTARKLYIDSYKFMFKKEQGFGQSMDVLDAHSKDEVRDIGAILYVQCAKGAFRMGMYESCQRYLQTCLDEREKSVDKRSSKNNLRIVLPIIKLKTEQFRQETMNLSQGEKLKRLEKIQQVLREKLEITKREELEGNIILPTQIKEKSLLLEQKLESKLIKLVIGDIAEKQTGSIQNQQQKAANAKLAHFVQEAFKTFDQNYDEGSEGDEEVKNVHMSGSGWSETVRAKLGYRFSKLTDKLLRKLEDDKAMQGPVAEVLKKIKQDKETLSCMTVKLSLQALNSGYLKASDAIPRLLDVVSKSESKEPEQEFIRHSKDTPAWMFLRWINQLIAVINRSESTMITDKIGQIARKYPQVLYYPFKVVESNIDVNLFENEMDQTRLFKLIRQYFDEKYTNLNTWTEALDCLIDPEHRAQYWLGMIFDVTQDAPSAQQKIEYYLKRMQEDVAAQQKPLIGDQIGSYNRQFAKKFAAYLQKNPIKNLSQEKKIKELKKLWHQIKQCQIQPGLVKLSQFSDYLANLDNNDFYNPQQYIEVPGQFEGTLLSEPMPGKNVKIASVKQELLLLGSIKRPKRITVHGSNEKDFHLLIKGGEDLRLDQRVQQLFSIMNKIFREDPTCLNREIYLKTFNVVPITNRLGSLEWVDNTEPLKALIDREHRRLENGLGLNQAKPLHAIMDWLKKLPCNDGVESAVHQCVNVLGLRTDIVQDAFTRHTKCIRQNLLRNGLENLCLSSAAFITIKNQFIKSIATFSIASYLIGIGDRHLENFLVDTTDGEVFGIDFGIAFGSGIHLATPELMPFRLTQQIENVIAPHPLEGAYKQTMVHAMNALRKRKSLILDTCDIFVKEPLLDWVKEAKTKLLKQDQDVDISERDSKHLEELEQLAFLPRKKILIVKDKLNGVLPSKIMVSELEDSKHRSKPYYKQLVQTIYGSEDSFRGAMSSENKKFLDVSEQIDCLIEQAKDPDILGRAWIGWSGYI